MEAEEQTPEDAKQTEERYPEFIHEKLGRLEFVVGDGEVALEAV